MADNINIETGRDDKGRFASKDAIQQAALKHIQALNRQHDKTKSKVIQTTGAIKTQDKIITKLLKNFDKANKNSFKHLAKYQKQFAKQQKNDLKTHIKALNKSNKQSLQHVQKMQRQYQRLAREKIKASKVNMRGGGLGIGGFGMGSVISTAAIYGAFRKLMNTSTPFLQAEINARGSAIHIKNAMLGNVAGSKAAGLVSAYQSMGAAQMFNTSPDAIKGLLRLQSELARGAGADIATQLVQDLTASYGNATDSLNRFLEASAHGRNIQEVLKSFASGRNITETTRALNALSIAQDSLAGKNDPLVESNIKITQSLDKLDAKIENIINQLTKKLIPAIETITNLVDKMSPETLALLGGGAMLAPGLLSVGGGYLGGKLATRGLLSGAKLAGGAGLGLGAGSSTAGALAGATGILAGAAAIAGISALGLDVLTDRHHKGAALWWLEAKQRGLGSPLDQANDLKLKQLKAEAKRLKAEAAAKVIPQQKEIAEKIKEATDKLPKPTDKLTALQQQAARQQQSELNAQVAKSITSSARAAYEYAKLSPFGNSMGLMQALPEFNSMQKSIRDEIVKLQSFLETIDISNEHGLIQSQQIKQQIMELRRDEKQNNIELLQGMRGGYIDAVQQLAFGAGRFSKIVTTKDLNMGKGDIVKFCGLAMIKRRPS